MRGRIPQILGEYVKDNKDANIKKTIKMQI